MINKAALFGIIESDGIYSEKECNDFNQTKKRRKMKAFFEYEIQFLPIRITLGSDRALCTQIMTQRRATRG